MSRLLPRPLLALLAFGLLGWAPTSAASDGTERTAFTYAGGPGFDDLEAVAAGPDGTVYVAGHRTDSASGLDVHVRRYSADLTRLLWSRDVGGAQTDFVSALKVMPDGSVLVVGWTYSSDFPTTPGSYKPTKPSGDSDAYVLKLRADGGTVFSTFLGGVSSDRASDVDFDPSGRPVVVGEAECGFPLVATPEGTWNNTCSPWGDNFVVKLAADGSRLERASFIGGNGVEAEPVVAVSRATGSVLVAMETSSTDLPTSSTAYRRAIHPHGNDLYVVKLDNLLTRMDAGTYLHVGWESEATSIVRDSGSNVWVGGWTTSPDMGTTSGAYQRALASPTGCGPRANVDLPCDDGFAMRLAPDLSRLVYGTYIGGNSRDAVEGLRVDGAGRAFLGGFTMSTDFAPTPARPFKGMQDGFFGILSADGARLEHLEPLVGNDTESIEDLTLVGGAAYVAGYTYSRDIQASPGAAQPAGDGDDGFVARYGKPASSFDATFTGVKGNEWWVEAKVTGDQPIAKVEASANGGAWRALTLRSWGAWAASFHVPEGSIVQLRATSGAGATDLSQCHRWTAATVTPCGGDPDPGTFDATFRNVRGNEWWVETDVSVAGGTLAGVDARVDGGSWIPLEKRSWGSWAKSLHAPAGSVVEFRARSTDGATDVSGGYRWPPG